MALDATQRREIMQRILALAEEQGIPADQIYRRLPGVSLGAWNMIRREPWKRMGARLMEAICTLLRTTPIWVLRGTGPVKVPLGQPTWTRFDEIPPGCTDRLRGYGTPKPPAPAKVRVCVVCGAEFIQKWGEKRRFPGRVCRNPQCAKDLSRTRWEAGFARATIRLGVTPCRACWAVPPEPGKTTCASCTKAEQQRCVERGEAKREQGLCSQASCMNPLKPGSTLCHMHHELRLEKLIAFRNRFRARPSPELYRRVYTRRLERCRRRWVCFVCGQPAEPNHKYPLCSTHRTQSNKAKRCRRQLRRFALQQAIQLHLSQVRGGRYDGDRGPADGSP